LLKFVKYAVTFFTLILIPIYFRHYGGLHFLWISDIALFLTVIALWRKSTLIFSVLMVFTLPLELVWNIDFFFELVSGSTLIGLAEYMFKDDNPLYLRLLSLFHVFMPPIWIWQTIKLGYDRRALKYASVLLWLVIPITYFLTEPDDNVNWVYLYQKAEWDWMPPFVWPLIYMILFPVLLYLPTHKLLKRKIKEPLKSN
jgi:hypothetical protein